MLIGLDFDNTIVRYDRLFHRLAVERGLVPLELPATKQAVRDFLRACGKEDEWTELQGIAYGPRITDAEPWPGVRGFLRDCWESDMRVVIVSHKTRYPYRGEKHDLHAAAHAFLEAHGFYYSDTGLSPDRVFLELTLGEKLARIGSLGCAAFVDDLPDVLAEPGFPAGVRKVLFDPAGAHTERPTWVHVNSWERCAEVFSTVPPHPEQNAKRSVPTSPPSMGERCVWLVNSERSRNGPPTPTSPPYLGERSPNDATASEAGEGACLPPDTPAIDRLTRSAGFGRVRAFVPLSGGKNNRVFHVTADNGEAVLKAYFQHPDDPCDRLGAEFAFARFAWAAGVRCIPEPLACDPGVGLGLFEFVRARSPGLEDVTESTVAQAAVFVHDLNAARWRPHASRLPVASEACFSIAEHLGTVAGRIDRLLQIEGEEVAEFVRRELIPAWLRVRQAAERRARDSGMSLGRVLDPTARCVSPSDFGFHNALVEPDGRVRFLDFEYAGWDDPAKLICDFFCQPAAPVPPRHFDWFTRDVALSFPDAELVIRRARLLLPVYRVKWVCIRLNEFLPASGRRRAFSLSADELETRKATQLAAAREALAAIHTEEVPA